MRSLARHGLWLVFVLSLGLGCSSSKHESAPMDDGSKASASDATMMEGLRWISRAYPTGDKSTSTLLLESGIPAEVTAGSSYDYVIKVTNLTDLNLENVIVQDKPEGNFRLEKSMPSATSTDGMLRWNLGNLRPRGSKSVTVTVRPAGTGAVTHCCEVDWRSVVCNTTQVVEPKLALVKEGTTEALTCDPIVYKLTVSNGGTGVARNVVIEDALPSGLTTIEGQPSVRIAVGDLDPGKSKSYTVRCKASKSGSYSNSASASAEPSLSAKSGTITTVVTRPQLAITKSAPEQAFMGRSITYTIMVKNTGDGIAKDATLEDPVPAGATFESATAGGTLQKGVVRWNFGTLKPNESREVSLTVTPDGSTSIRNTATAKAYCADAVSATAMTSVTGRPAILLEVVDLQDPIEVGKNVTYVIEATNQGTAADEQIVIECVLEDSQTFVSATGATEGKISGNTITFAPLASLGPKQKASWKVVVTAAKEGDVRFTVRMNTSTLTRPVQETEATQQYK